MAPVCFDIRLVKLVTKDMRGMACSQCDKRQSTWIRTHHAPDENPYVCSLCLVYESSWGVLERGNWDVLIQNVEQIKGKTFEKNEKGELVNCSDADGLMMAVYMENQVQRTARARRTV